MAVFPPELLQHPKLKKPLRLGQPVAARAPLRPEVSVHDPLVSETSDLIQSHASALALLPESPLKEAGKALAATLADADPGTRALLSPVVLGFQSLTLTPPDNSIDLLPLARSLAGMTPDSIAQAAFGFRTAQTALEQSAPYSVSSAKTTTDSLLAGYIAILPLLKGHASIVARGFPIAWSVIAQDLASQGVLGPAAALNDVAGLAFNTYRSLSSESLAAQSHLAHQQKRLNTLHSSLVDAELWVRLAEYAQQDTSTTPDVIAQRVLAEWKGKAVARAKKILEQEGKKLVHSLAQTLGKRAAPTKPAKPGTPLTRK